MQSDSSARAEGERKRNGGPLQGFRVVDLTTIGMGPYATQTMGDLGADIIKVEVPPKGDLIRDTAPGRSPGMASLFFQLNRSKRSLVLDLKQREGRDVLLRLVKDADVLIFNVRPKAMARLGLSYDDVAAVNPRIIYCALVGAGQDGPYAGRAVFDDLIQGASTLASLEARMGGEPRYAPAWIADQGVGLAAVNAVLAALLYRERTGAGQAVEVPMFETMTQFIMTPHLLGHTFRPPMGSPGYNRLFERRPYKTKDGYICASPYNEKQWRLFFDLIERPDLKADPRFAGTAGIAKNVGELYQIFADAMLTRTTAEWLVQLDEIDIPSMPFHTPESIQEDPHLVATGFFRDVDHPTQGRIRTMAVPTRWSKSRPAPERQAPLLGEHSEEILREANYTESEIEGLMARKVSLAWSDQGRA
jgi:crotonobetainyl-CoA:carnitine CoA-transferase CaiB-like acyl-CoA transferase